MASKKQIHRKSRIPGIVPVARTRNQYNQRVIAELRKDPLGLTPIRVWKLDRPMSMTLQNRTIVMMSGYKSVDDIPVQFRKWPHLNDDIRNEKKVRRIKPDNNMIILKDLGYKPKQTKLKDKIKKINRFTDHAWGKANALQREYERAKNNIYYKEGKTLLTSSVAFGKQVMKIKLFIKINIKTIDYVERNNKGYYSHLQRTG